MFYANLDFSMKRQSNRFTVEHDRAELSLTVNLPGLKPACLADSSSPEFALSGSAALHQGESFNLRPIAAGCGFWERNSALGIPISITPYKHQPTNASTTTPSPSYTLQD